jgi:hypothetical protein
MSLSQNPRKLWERLWEKRLKARFSLKSKVTVPKLKFWEKLLFEVRRPPFQALAFFTFRGVFDLAVFKNGLHFNLPAAGTEEFLGCAGSTRVFTGLSHSFSPCR